MEKGANKMKTCIEGKLTTAGVTDFKKATKAQFDTARKGCDADAKLEFEKSGGEAGDYEMAKRKGARDKGADKMKTCIEGKLTTAGVTDFKKTTKAQFDTARKACDGDAKLEYEKSGGKAGDYEMAKRKGAME